ncbi:MAG: hypothetical protein OEZ06_05530 [Myxococcales bacterium]|nr:hypothetical protein [Myxococcales bacterium]
MTDHDARTDDRRGYPIVGLGLLLAVGACLALLAAAAGAEQRPAPHGDLLAGRLPLQSLGLRCAPCLTDGVVALEGEPWSSRLTASLENASARVDYDLGAPRDIDSVYLQADHNDLYELWISDDGQRFRRLWTSQTVPLGGLRARQQSGLAGRARYLRLKARGGDGRYSISELKLFAEPPADLSAFLRVEAHVAPADFAMRSAMLLLGLALGFAVLLSTRGRSLAPIAALLALAGWQLSELVSLIAEHGPAGPREVGLLRAVVAALAALLVLHDSPWLGGSAENGRGPFGTRLRSLLLAACAVASVLAFYNLLQPQFRNVEQGRDTYVHLLDLRQYYATAKYFPEIGYRGLYAADIAAYRDDQQGREGPRPAQLPMRDLKSHALTTVAAQQDSIAHYRARFDAERWQAYRRDARYFRAALGEAAYFDTMRDYGGNATPVWIAMAGAFFNRFEAGEAGFLWGATADLLLLALMFVAIGRSFGHHTAFLAMVLFGANDFITYGTNWSGATLRHDWLAYLGLGLSALRVKRHALAGGLLALATAIRAFPILALAGALLPLAVDLLQALWQRSTPLGTVLQRRRGELRLLIGALLTGALLFLSSGLLLSFEAWSDWFVKVQQLSAEPHGNHIGLRAVLGGWGPDQAILLRHRELLHIAAITTYSYLAFRAARRCEPAHAGVFGLSLLPVFFYPANYYLHIICLMPLGLRELRGSLPFTARQALALLALLLLCVAQYFGTLLEDVGIHFHYSTLLLFAALPLYFWLSAPEQAEGVEKAPQSP